MATSIKRDVDILKKFEKQLTAQLSRAGHSLHEIADTLEQCRTASQDAILLDFEGALKLRLELSLWEAHVKVNKRFRAELAKQAKENTPRSVESLKSARKEYLAFIKSSQQFYRAFIRALATAHGGIPELGRVAHRLYRDYASTHEAATKQSIPKEKILRSCYNSLIYLGDLSRWRETELAGNENRNWAPAIGFYDLAATILPQDGTAQNQLSLIALADGNLLRGVYHLYRALSTPEQQSKPLVDNLTRAYQKIEAQAGKAKLIYGRSGATERGNTMNFTDQYLALLAACFRGKDIVKEVQLEQRMLVQLEHVLKMDESKGTTYRLVFINTAAITLAEESFKKQALSDDGDIAAADQSYRSFLRLNMQCFLVILKHACVVLRDGPAATEHGSATLIKLTPAQGRVLTLLRLYNSWLLKNAHVVAQPLDDNFSSLHFEFWDCYSAMLNSLIERFRDVWLLACPYLLEEDLNTLAFLPLRCAATEAVWSTNGIPKPAFYDLDSAIRDEVKDDFYRIGGLTEAAAKLVENEHVPLAFDDNRLRFYSSVSGKTEHQPLSESSQDLLSVNDNHKHYDEESYDAERMVESLVGTFDDSDVDPYTEPTYSTHHMQSSSTLESKPSFPIGSHTASDLVNAVLNYSESRPRLGSPQGVSNDHHTYNRKSSSLSYGVPFQPFGGVMPSGNARASTTNLQDKTSNEHDYRKSLASTSSPPIGNGLANGHSRHNSTDSVRSNIWTPDEAWNSFKPSSGKPLTPLGNGTFRSANIAEQDTTDYGMSSSMLFGAGSSPWTVSELDSRKFSVGSPRISGSISRDSTSRQNSSSRPSSRPYK